MFVVKRPTMSINNTVKKALRTSRDGYALSPDWLIFLAAEGTLCCRKT